MTREEIKTRLNNIAEHAIHTRGEKPFILSLDDGIALKEAVEILSAESCEEDETPTAVLMLNASSLCDTAEREAAALGCRFIPERYEWEISGNLMDKCQTLIDGFNPYSRNLYLMGIRVRRVSEDKTFKLWKEIKP